jgi:hypothetical protein
MQKQYSSAFHKVKQDKHMKFFDVLGSVSLTIELSDRSVTCKATPLQATVLDAVSKKGSWRGLPFPMCRLTLNSSVSGQCTWQEIASRVGIDDEKVIKHALNHWINQGVLQTGNDGLYSVSDKQEVEMEEPSILCKPTSHTVSSVYRDLYLLRAKVDTAEAVVLETPLETRADMETHRWTVSIWQFRVSLR